MITAEQRMAWLEKRCSYIEYSQDNGYSGSEDWWSCEQECDEEMNRWPCTLTEWIDEQIRKEKQSEFATKAVWPKVA